MGSKAESTIISQKAINLMFLVEFQLKCTSNNGAQLFVDQCIIELCALE